MISTCSIATYAYTDYMSDAPGSKSHSGGKAVGAYLRKLRESRGLSVAEIAEKLGSEPSQIWRIEKWRSDTRSSLVFKFIALVRGSAEDVFLLMNNPNATEEDGERLADLRLQLEN